MIERIVSLGHRVIDPLKTFLRGPYALLAAAGLTLVLGGLALRERDARLRRSIELEQLRTETAARLKELETRSAEALRAANQRNALVIGELEAARLQLSQQGDKLRQHLAALERDERVRVERVATLPSQELAERVAARLDAGAGEVRDSGFATRDSKKSGDLVNPRFGDSAISKSPDHQITKSPHHSGATATGETAAVGTPPLQNDAGDQRSPLQQGAPAMRTSPLQKMELDTAALRKVETAFVELDSCRAQAAVKDQQAANCREQLNSSAAIAERLGDSVRQLNEAVRLKDEILARREAEYRAELKAARGSRWDRFRKAVTYVAAGVVAGVALAR